MTSAWNWNGAKGMRSRRRPRGRPFRPLPPTSKLLLHESTVFNKDDIVGKEIKPSESVRYKMRKVMVTCTVRMPPGELLNFIIVKCSSPLVNWAGSFTQPALLVKENSQDMITILARGKIETTGLSGHDCAKSFSRFVRLGSGVSQSQHLYLVIFTSEAMKAVLEHRMYLDV
ncbi:capsid protein [Pea yellow stunt virus]|uniref:Capsid protein n=1 Tax=Pea yellow stunt virus TaxID=1436892 RepID=V9TNH9_9VIRU|nr:capsid protein [Pea yellow stunt virus]AHC72282.1 capsid protein [Pea yellow stunt virus]